MCIWSFSHLLHQVLVSLLDAGVGDRFLRVADGVNHISLTALPVTAAPAVGKKKRTNLTFIHRLISSAV